MGISVRVISIIKDKEGDIVAVRGREILGGRAEEEEKTYTSSFICDGLRVGNTIESRHSFYVKTLDGKGQVMIECEEKNRKLCLVANSNRMNLLENYPEYVSVK
jgi:hypothetical protein